MEIKELSSNWKQLQSTLQPQIATVKLHPQTYRNGREQGIKRKRVDAPTPVTRKNFKVKRLDKAMDQLYPEGASGTHGNDSVSSRPPTSTSSKIALPKDRINQGLSSTVEVGRYIAIDCEMVGIGPNPDRESALARVSAVNFHGDQVYDSYVKPKQQVTDWRTHVSGITSKHMIEARPLEHVRADIAAVLDGKTLVGHAVRNDLAALMLSHPKRDIRDTARHPPYRKFAGGGSPKLKILAAEFLGLNIQTGEHSSIEDARASMLLFRREKDVFEREHAKKWPTNANPESKTGQGINTSERKKKEKKSKTKKKKRKRK